MIAHIMLRHGAKKKRNDQISSKTSKFESSDPEEEKLKLMKNSFVHVYVFV